MWGRARPWLTVLALLAVGCGGVARKRDVAPRAVDAGGSEPCRKTQVLVKGRGTWGQQLGVHAGYVYYSEYSPLYAIYRVAIEGGDAELVTEMPLGQFGSGLAFDDTAVYFTEWLQGWSDAGPPLDRKSVYVAPLRGGPARIIGDLNGCNLDGGIAVTADSVYAATASCPFGFDRPTLMRFPLSGDPASEVPAQGYFSIDIVATLADAVYFRGLVEVGSSIGRILRLRAGSSTWSEIVEAADLGAVTVSGDAIYYVDGGTVMRTKLDGTEPVKVLDGLADARTIAVSGSNLYAVEAAPEPDPRISVNRYDLVVKTAELVSPVNYYWYSIATDPTGAYFTSFDGDVVHVCNDP
jgi:hypothetical protein